MSLETTVRGMLTLARVARSVVEAAKHVIVDTTGHRDDATPYWQPYGLQAAPKDGAAAVQAAIGGRADSLITILVADRRYTIALEDGEVALVDDLGQKVHLTRSGIVVEADPIKLGEGATLGVARVTDPVRISTAWNTWFTGLATAASYTTAKPSFAPIGNIDSGSEKTLCE